MNDISETDLADSIEPRPLTVPELSQLMVHLLKGVLYRQDDEHLWSSLLRLQAASFTDERLQEAFDQSQSRVTSMALIHEKLYKGDELASVDVALYIHELFSELIRMNDVQERIQHRTDIDEGLAFGLNTMVPLGLLLNELITNSFKHAFKGREKGLVTLGLHRSQKNVFDLHYADDGLGIPIEKMQPDGGTLGMSLIESLVEQLNGRMTLEGGSHGTSYHIRFSGR